MDRAWSMHGTKRNEYSVLAGKSKRKRPEGRTTLKWEDNIKIDLREIGWGNTD
jgi:hypothetical protein